MTHRHDLLGCVHKQRQDLRLAPPAQVIRKTWQTPIEKAQEPEEPEFQWLHDIADRAEPAVRQRFLEAIRAIRGTIKEAQLRAALESGNIDEVMQVLGLDRNFESLQSRLLSPLANIVQSAGTAALDATPALAAAGGTLALRFDMVNPHTVQAVRTYGFNLIRQITDDTRDGIREIVANALQYGGHPYVQARKIRNLIGLTERQAQAVGNFRRALETGDEVALERELRDHRFDGTLRRALGPNATHQLTEEQIDQQVERYGERMLQMRAKTIARTETINAARLGTQGAWVQATENGWLERGKVRQGWIVTPDDLLCVFCAAVPAMNPGGVPLGQQFQTPLGPVDGPGLHPNCRCAVYLMEF